MKAALFFSVLLATCLAVPAEAQQTNAIDMLQRPGVPVGAVNYWATVIDPVPVSGSDVNELSALVKLRSASKQVLLEWQYLEIPGDEESAVWIEQPIDVSFWPTAAVALSGWGQPNNHLLVAGKSPATGNTLIERWEVELNTIPSSSELPVVKSHQIYNKKTAGELVVRHFGSIRKNPSAVWAQFEDSRDIVLVDAYTGATSVLFDATATPGLERSHAGWMSFEYPGVGFVTFLRDDPGVRQGGIVAMIDGDKDGTLDSIHEFTGPSSFYATYPTSNWLP